MTDSFPTSLARGVTRKECLDGKTLKACAFKFFKNHDNGLSEMSIQWLDNWESEEILKRMRKDDHPQFMLGFGILQTATLDHMKALKEYEGMDYCYARSEANPYHGHITVPLEKDEITRQIAAELAHIAKYVSFGEFLLEEAFA